MQAIGADVTVTASSLTKLVVTFTGEDGNKNQSLIYASNVKATTGTASTAITTTTVTDGVSGEFLVNDTTAGNQMYADVAMDDTGAFVITWTSYGQDGDSAIGRQHLRQELQQLLDRVGQFHNQFDHRVGRLDHDEVRFHEF